MVHEHNGRPATMPREVEMKPLQLRWVEEAPRLPRLLGVESDEVVGLIVEAVVVRGIRRGRGRAQHAVEGNAVVVVPHEEAGGAR